MKGGFKMYLDPKNTSDLTMRTVFWPASGPPATPLLPLASREAACNWQKMDSFVCLAIFLPIKQNSAAKVCQRGSQKCVSVRYSFFPNTFSVCSVFALKNSIHDEAAFGNFAYISLLMVAKICSHCFFATTHTVKHWCCECDEILAIYRQCIEICRWRKLYGVSSKTLQGSKTETR